MRYISASFQDVLDSRRRRPAYKIYAWDPATVTISRVASAPGNLHASIPMPLDITRFDRRPWTVKGLGLLIRAAYGRR